MCTESPVHQNMMMWGAVGSIQGVVTVGNQWSDGGDVGQCRDVDVEEEL